VLRPCLNGRAVAVAAFACTCVPALARAETLAVPLPGALPLASQSARTLGVLERESVEDALAMLGLHLDPSPQGKTIGHV